MHKIIELRQALIRVGQEAITLKDTPPSDQWKIKGWIPGFIREVLTSGLPHGTVEANCEWSEKTGYPPFP